MGLVNLKHIPRIFEKRGLLTECYHTNLKKLRATVPVWHSASQSNFAYYPLVFESEALLLKVMNLLQQHEIFPARYFYPSLAKFYLTLIQ
jgi:dTDP-4-amino-4,6-dideoxygalactose transaminase